MPIQSFENRLFLLQTHRTTYALGIDAHGLLRHLYYGATVTRPEDFLEDLRVNRRPDRPDLVMEEFTSFGCLHAREASHKITYPDRTRDFRYLPTVTECADDRLVLSLRDRDYDYEVRLHYVLHPEYDLIERFTEVCNPGDAPVTLHRLFSAELSLPGRDFSVMNVSGVWAQEQKLHADRVSGGKKVYESNVGTTGFSSQPWIAAFKQADEVQGEVYFGALRYTGNFKIIAESVPYGYMNLLLGINDTDFSLSLAPGAAFETPHAYLGFTKEGFGGMSRLMHRYERERLMPKIAKEKPLPVLYNSWYSTYFDVFGDDQEKLADKAAQIGVELFVIDDGWFGKRNHDRAGLGDWYVNPEKFPQGLHKLIDHVHGLGMDFGLWIEPEMVNPDSDLYRAHPDWVYSYPKREILTGRHQYALNLTNPEVVDYLTETFDTFLNTYPVDYIKWDMNRFMAEALDAGGEDGMVWHRHADGFIRFAKVLRERHPHVSFEACAGGGGRVNLETLTVFDQFWTSDNVDPLDRCFIQEGYSYLYPTKYMRAWVTDDESMPLLLRSRCAMCGAYGIGTDLNGCPQSELETLKTEIALYKEIRPLVQEGDLYRLASMTKDGFQCWQYVKGDEACVITIVDHYATALPRLRLQGLDPDGIYTLEDRRYSGAYLMEFGIETASNQDRMGTVLRLKRER